MKDFEQFPWEYIDGILSMGDEPHWPTVLATLKVEYSAQVSPCPICGAPASELTWIPLGTCEESWEAGQGEAGYLTVCLTCRKQVDFLLEPTSTEIEAENRAAGGSTFGSTWRRQS